MRTIEEIQADLAQLRDKSRTLHKAKEARVEAFKAQLQAEYRAEIDVLSEDIDKLVTEETAAHAALASSQWEGRRVTRQVRRGFYHNSKSETQRGIVVCVRSGTDYPAWSRDTKIPQIGETIVQRVNAKGEKLTKWERLWQDKLGSWTLED